MSYFKSVKIGLGSATVGALAGGVIATVCSAALAFIGVGLGIASVMATGSLAGFIAGYGLVSALGATAGGILGSGISGFIAHDPPKRFRGRTAMAAGLALTAACSYGSLTYLYNRATTKPAAAAPAPVSVAKVAASTPAMRLTA